MTWLTTESADTITDRPARCALEFCCGKARPFLVPQESHCFCFPGMCAQGHSRKSIATFG